MIFTSKKSIHLSITLGLICALCMSAVFIFTGCSEQSKNEESEAPSQNAVTTSAATESTTPQATESTADNTIESTTPAAAANPDTQSGGDDITPKNLVGTWKLVSVDEEGKVTNNNAKFGDLTLAFYWIEFNADGTAVFSTAPQKGESDVETPYEIKDQKILFKGESFSVTSGKIVDGKLLIADNSSSIGGKNAVFTLEKQ